MPAKITAEFTSTIRLDCDLCKVFYEGPATSHLVMTPVGQHFLLGMEPILKRLGWGMQKNPHVSLHPNEPPYIVICPVCIQKALKDLENSKDVTD